jgi:hypothetical protein
MRRSFDRCNFLDLAEQWERMADSAERRAGERVKASEGS